MSRVSREPRFLKNVVRRRAPAAEYKPTHAPDSAWTLGVVPREREEIEDPPGRFFEELRLLGGHGERVASSNEARAYLLRLVADRGARSVVRWDVKELEEMGLDPALEQIGVEIAVWKDLGADFREVAGRADIGISTADWAIAETGSLVFESGLGRGRTVTLLPPTHVAILPADRVLRTVPEAIEKYAANGPVPANLCFHTGPSRSGDIEMSLFVGMHGPGDVHVLLIG